MKICGTVWLLFVTAAMAWTQGTTFQEQANRLQNINAFLLDFRPNAPPDKVGEGTFEVALDINPQPSINTRVGNKDEPVDPPSVVPKVRGRYLFSNGLVLGAAYAPGIEFQDYKAEFISLEAGFRFVFAKVWHLGVRASYTDGDVEGPITEPGVEDKFNFTNNGADVSLGRPWRSFVFYGFAGFTDIETDLTVAVDGAFLTNSENTYYGGLGASYDWKRLRLNFEQNTTDDYLQHVTLSLSYRF